MSIYLNWNSYNWSQTLLCVFYTNWNSIAKWMAQFHKIYIFCHPKRKNATTTKQKSKHKKSLSDQGIHHGISGAAFWYVTSWQPRQHQLLRNVLAVVNLLHCFNVMHRTIGLNKKLAGHIVLFKSRFSVVFVVGNTLIIIAYFAFTYIYEDRIYCLYLWLKSKV